MVQITGYPGIYIEEFAPGAPIQGVGTSTAAFIGTAAKGPIKTPTLIQSWDAFVATFGDIIAEPPTSYLAPAVFGFFLNGGTTCYIVRASTGVNATANLNSLQSGTPPPPALVAQALQEGAAGDSIAVQVVHSSLLADQLTKAGASGTTLSVHRAQADVTAMTSDRRSITVSDTSGFAAGERILLTKGSTTAIAVVQSTQAPNTLNLAGAIPGSEDFGTGTVTVRTADLVVGQKTLRLVIPTGLRLNQALPAGAIFSITRGGTTEVATVATSGGDTITLVDGLTNSYPMDDAANLPTVASLEFDLVITDANTGSSETFQRLSMSDNHPNSWRAIASNLITLQAPPTPPTPNPRPAANTYSLTNGADDNRADAWSDITADASPYLTLLEAYDDVALVSIPGATDADVQGKILAHCEKMHDRFAILDSMLGATPGNGIRDQLATVIGGGKGFGALYYPWILARNPKTGRDELQPPSGHLAGIYARTDAQQGVHKAPANTNIRGALGLERRLTDDEQAPLNLMGINVLRVFPGQAQPVVWGARTTASDRNWQYVNVRRLFLFLEESIEEGIRWAVFEPNNLQLWQKLKRTISEFLTRVWRDGALFGATAKEAFYVRIDEALNPPSTQALGRLYIEVGVRPVYPAEFIILRIGIWQGGSDVTEG